MAAYVIAKKGSELLDTPVFHAGESNDEEAVAVFTSADAAGGYIEAAGWTGEQEVGELDALQLLCWLVKAHQEGIRYLAVNPDRSPDSAGGPLVIIEEKLAGIANQVPGEIFASG